MLLADIFSSDVGEPNDERRTMRGVTRSQHSNRLVLVTVSGGMMDLGWAQKVLPSILEPCQAYVDGEVPAADALVREIRSTLDRLEIEQKRFASAQLVAIDVAALPEGGARVAIARIGAERIWICGENAPRRVGRENAWPVEPGEHGFDGPVIVTASIRPTKRWNIRRDGGPGFELVDETTIADDAVRGYREETIDITDPKDISIVVVSHPFWIGFVPTDLPSASSHAAIAKRMKEHVDPIVTWDACAVVVLARPVS